MPLVTELDLPTLPVEQPEFCADPTPYVERARSVHPWLARFSAGYIVHGYHAVRDLVYMDDKLRTGLGDIVEFYEAQGTPWARFMEEMILSRSGAEHARLRASVAGAFTPRRAHEARPLMRAVITQLLDEWAPRGAFDFTQFAALFPVTVLCGLLGVPAEAIPRIRAAIESHMDSLTFNRAIRAEFMAAYELLWNFADELVRERESGTAVAGDSLLDAMIASQRTGQLSGTELRHMLLVLLIAGYDTSKNLLGFTVHTLLSRPALWEACAHEPATCAKVIEEMLRYSTIATYYRQVAVEFEYDGVRFPQGTLLAFSTPLAGRDPAAFPEPLRFDPDREHTTRHVAFGRGAHICLGQFIARAQLEEGLHLIARRLRQPRLDGAVSWRTFLGAWGLRSLPIAFDPAPAA